MLRPVRCLLALLTLVIVAGCGGGSSDSGVGGAKAAGVNPQYPWIGVWNGVSENALLASGQLVLTLTSFSQTSIFAGGFCTWTGSVSGVTATNLTITTLSASGSPQCSQAVGQSASPAWTVSADNNTLTLDYSNALSFGTVQVWSRGTDGMSDK